MKQIDLKFLIRLKPYDQRSEDDSKKLRKENKKTKPDKIQQKKLHRNIRQLMNRKKPAEATL